jgi:hypothetical protein
VPAQAKRLPDRHGAANTEAPRLVGGRGDDATGAAADDDRLAAQLRPAADLDAGVEGVHVDVQDRAARVVAVPAADRTGYIGAASHDG